MYTEQYPRGTDQEQDTKRTEGQLISWRLLVAAGGLGLLSLIDESQLTEGLKISGGVTLAALAAMVLLWPVVQQITARGGEIDLKKLRLKVNQISNETQRLENDNVMKIQELESEIGDLRTRLSNEGGRIEAQRIEEDESVLKWAAESYMSASHLQAYQKRVEIDKEVVRRGRGLSLPGIANGCGSSARTAFANC